MEYKQPNIIVILADDLGYGDLGCYGSRDIRTPHLDALAEQGVRMTDYYAAAPVCTPTRCALMTGRYPQRVSNLEWAIHPGVKTVGLPPEEITIATILRNLGYATGLFGKWHLGYREEWGPNQHGFNEFFGILSGNVDYFRHIENNREPDLYENTTPIKKSGYLTDLITERAVDFIERHSHESFFLNTAYTAPHWPIQGPDDVKVELTQENWSKHGDRKTYAQMVERMDQGIGRILEILQKEKVEENTFVIFISDNGGERLASNGTLSGQKGHLREGGIRVPCILRWPVFLPAGRNSYQTAITMDITAGIMAAVKKRPPRHLDGMPLFPYISGKRPDVERTFVWRVNLHPEKAVRWGNWKWLQEKEQNFLFNLDEDISESTDRKERNSDIFHHLQTVYSLWEKAMPYNQTLFGDDLKKL